METRSKIIEEASKLFADKGYSAASVRNIASAVGIRESAIYNHFESKLAILIAFIENSAESIECKNLLTDDLINHLTNPPKFLLKFTEVLIERWSLPEERTLFTILVKEDSNIDFPEGFKLTDYKRNLESILNLVFTQMVKHKFIANLNPEKLSELFFAPLILMKIEQFSFNKDLNLKVIEKYIKIHVDEFYNLIRRK